jgi:hypothetical protein
MKAMQLDHDMLLRAARMMEGEGGSFAYCPGVLCRRPE